MKFAKIIFCIFFCYFLLANYAMANSKPGFSVISMNKTTIENFKQNYSEFSDTNLVKGAINTKICSLFYLPDVSKFENKPLKLLVDTLKRKYEMISFNFPNLPSSISKEEEQIGELIQIYFKVNKDEIIRLIGIVYFSNDSILNSITNKDSLYLFQDQYMISIYKEPVSYLISIWAERQKNKGYDFIYKSEVDMIINYFPNKVKELKKKVNIKKINKKK